MLRNWAFLYLLIVQDNAKNRCKITPKVTVKSWFPIFLLGAVFGKLIEKTGAAKSVVKKVTQLIGEKRAVLGVLIAAVVLT